MWFSKEENNTYTVKLHAFSHPPQGWWIWSTSTKDICQVLHTITVFTNPKAVTHQASLLFCHCRFNFWQLWVVTQTERKKKIYFSPKMTSYTHTTVAKISIQSGASAFEKTRALSGSSSAAQPDDCKLGEWLFPWFCGFVQLEQWPHCNPRLFTFQQISSYWNHGEGRAGVKEDSHAPYLCKTNTCLTWNTQSSRIQYERLTMTYQHKLWPITSLFWNNFPPREPTSLLCPSLAPFYCKEKLYQYK